MQDDLAEQAPRRIVLAGEEVYRRKVLLVRLQDVLTGWGVESVIVGRRVLTLRGTGPAPPARPVDPELHILGSGHDQVVTTEGSLYRSADGRTHPADDPGGAAGCFLEADTGRDCPSSQVPALAYLGAGGRDGTVVGAGERALRCLRDDGVI